jgi:phospholipase C
VAEATEVSRLEVRLARAEGACGCPEGAAAAVGATAIYAVVVFWPSLQLGIGPAAVRGLGAAVVFVLFAGLGKVAGLAVARLRARRLKTQLAYVMANRSPLALYISVTGTCSQWADQGYSQCTQWADQGYSQCTQWADQGYSQCCDWWPCSWLCDALVWIAKWVCMAAVWVAKWVCLAAVWIAKWVCIAVAWIVSIIWYWIIVLIWVACRVVQPPGKHTSPINHIFVLMLENRAFDHMLGFSALTGTDPTTGGATSVEGLSGQSNDWGGTTFPATQGADWVMPIDPGHEFKDTRFELCFDPESDPTPVYPDPGTGGYPPITNAGFAGNFASAPRSGDPAQIMRCYSPQQVPVITALAKEFALCDHWFSALPGPTWPNRFFIHAASSGGLDDSPSTLASVSGELINGYKFDNGTIYDLLDAEGLDWTIYEGDALPQSFAISGMNLAALGGHFTSYDDFHSDVNDPEYSTAYAFIEPNYGHDIIASNYKCGNSQHPLDDITRGEELIKDVYETIRNSPHWEDSLLIVTYDEHGGFYDHVAPPAGVPPGDSVTDPANNMNNFQFDQLGVRVPAVIVSPRIPSGLIDHRTYDHTSALRTIEDVFTLDPLTNRDAVTRSLTPLLSLTTPRTDAPTALPNAAESGITECDDPAVERQASTLSDTPQLRQPPDSSMRGFLHIGLLRDLFMSDPGQKAAIVGRYSRLETQAQAFVYLEDVRQRYDAFRTTSLPEAQKKYRPKKRRPRLLPKFRTASVGVRAPRRKKR